MNEKICRVCDRDLFKSPIFTLQSPPSAQGFTTILHKDNYPNKLEIYQCSKCGLIQLLDPPVWYYKDVVRSAGISPEMKSMRYLQFSDFLKNYDLQDKKIIEIGCGGGEYLSILNTLTSNAYGLENNERLAYKCKLDNLKVFNGYIDAKNFKIPEGPFDAFYIFNFLEHVPYPTVFLDGLINNLTSEGIGIIEVPNFDMMLNNNLYAEFIKDHLTYFTKDTLTFLLINAGFEILKYEEIFDKYILSVTVRKRQQLKLLNFSITETKLLSDIVDFIKKYKHTVVWGAGHQGLTIASNPLISYYIDHIVDDNPDKQGMYAPGNIPVISPKEMEEMWIDAIIIMAGGYSKFIFEKIKHTYGNKYKIAIVEECKLKIYD